MVFHFAQARQKWKKKCTEIKSGPLSWRLFPQTPSIPARSLCSLPLARVTQRWACSQGISLIAHRILPIRENLLWTAFEGKDPQGYSQKHWVACVAHFPLTVVVYQNLRFPLTYLWPGQQCDAPSLTIAAGTVASYIIFEGLLLMVISMMMKK